MTFNKTQLALGVAAATFSLAMIAPQAQAASVATAQAAADEAAQKAEALELQVQQMAAQMQALQAQLNSVKATADDAATTQKVQELDQWMASVKHAPEAVAPKDNVVRIRGGWGYADNPRGNSTVGGTLGANGDPLVGVGNSSQSMYYYGAAFDYNINNDLFGLMDDTSFQIEFGLEYGNFANSHQNGLVTETRLASTTNTFATTTNNGSMVEVTQLRINASPKIKFMHDSKLRPWIIPVGMDINIISPPSGSVTVLGTGMNFGAGVDYDVWKGIIVGLDGRYHYTTSNINGVNTDGFTLGGSVGFKF